MCQCAEAGGGEAGVDRGVETKEWTSSSPFGGRSLTYDLSIHLLFVPVDNALCCEQYEKGLGLEGEQGANKKHEIIKRSHSFLADY